MHSKRDYSTHSKREYEQDTKYPLVLRCGFTTSFADADPEKINTQFHFDTDWVFIIWDNSTTGHICNDIRKFVPNSLWQSNKSLTMENKTGPCLQEGMVQLQLIENDRMKHNFILDYCLFHPSSLVNLLSTRQLAEKSIDSNRNSDEQTRIKSRYSTHVLTWSFGNLQKTFPTPVSGPPELLFDEGFCEFNSFCMHVPSFATTNEAQGISNIIPFNDEKMQHVTTSDNDEEINIVMINAYDKLFHIPMPYPMSMPFWNLETLWKEAPMECAEKCEFLMFKFK
jgi:hypothetical protein